MTGLKTDDIIVGLYSEEELEEYFTGQQAAYTEIRLHIYNEKYRVESMTTIIEECLQTLYTKVQGVNLDVHKVE